MITYTYLFSAKNNFKPLCDRAIVVFTGFYQNQLLILNLLVG
nr:MAG TPA: hypothetical protein [Caudoviricetes sp.]